MEKYYMRLTRKLKIELEDLINSEISEEWRKLMELLLK